MDQTSAAWYTRNFVLPREDSTKGEIKMADQDSENVENMDYEDSQSETSSDESPAEKINSDEEEELDSEQLSFKPIIDNTSACFFLRFAECRHRNVQNMRSFIFTKNPYVYFYRLAEKKKEAGNKAYTEKDYKLALKFYSEAIGMNL